MNNVPKATEYRLSRAYGCVCVYATMYELNPQKPVTFVYFCVDDARAE